jgi:putative ABC transport system substrate-binding protein
MSTCLRRRELIASLGGAAAWPLVARAQQALPVVGYVRAGGDTPERERAFRQGLGEAGYSEGRTLCERGRPRRPAHRPAA